MQRGAARGMLISRNITALTAVCEEFLKVISNKGL